MHGLVWKFKQLTTDGNWKQCSITYISFCGCLIYTAFEKQEKLIDRIIHGAEQIKCNIIPMCEIHSFNRSIVQLWAMLTFRTGRGGELHVNITSLHEHRYVTFSFS